MDETLLQKFPTVTVYPFRSGIRSAFSYWQAVQDSSLLNQFVASLEGQ